MTRGLSLALLALLALLADLIWAALLHVALGWPLGWALGLMIAVSIVGAGMIIPVQAVAWALRRDVLPPGRR